MVKQQEADPHTTTAGKPWRTPKALSDAEAMRVDLGDGREGRKDAQNRLLCNAKRRDGKLCMSPAITGMLKCRMHGAATPQARNMVKLRLTELVQPAIATLAREMANADKSSDRQAAANSILDRAGYGRVQKVETADAKEMLYQKLLQLQEEKQAAIEAEVVEDGERP